MQPASCSTPSQTMRFLAAQVEVSTEVVPFVHFGEPVAGTPHYVRFKDDGGSGTKSDWGLVRSASTVLRTTPTMPMVPMTSPRLPSRPATRGDFRLRVRRQVLPAVRYRLVVLTSQMCRRRLTSPRTWTLASVTSPAASWRRSRLPARSTIPTMPSTTEQTSTSPSMDFRALCDSVWKRDDQSDRRTAGHQWR